MFAVRHLATTLLASLVHGAAHIHAAECALLSAVGKPVPMSGAEEDPGMCMLTLPQHALVVLMTLVQRYLGRVESQLRAAGGSGGGGGAGAGGGGALRERASGLWETTVRLCSTVSDIVLALDAPATAAGTSDSSTSSSPPDAATTPPSLRQRIEQATAGVVLDELARAMRTSAMRLWERQAPEVLGIADVGFADMDVQLPHVRQLKRLMEADKAASSAGVAATLLRIGKPASGGGGASGGEGGDGGGAARAAQDEETRAALQATVQAARAKRVSKLPQGTHTHTHTARLACMHACVLIPAFPSILCV